MSKDLSRQGYCRGWSCLPQADLEQYWCISLEAHRASFIQQLALFFKVTINRCIIFSLVWCHIELIPITGLKESVKVCINSTGCQEDGWTRLDLIFLYHPLMLSFEIWNHSVGKSMPFFKSRITFFWTSSHFITKIIFPETSYVWSRLGLDLFFAISLYFCQLKYVISSKKRKGKRKSCMVFLFLKRRK